MVVTFFFMEIYSGFAAVIVWLIRLSFSIKYKRNIYIFFFITIITIILWFLTYKDSSSIIPIIASCLSTYWFFFLEKIKLRLVLLLTSSFWLSFSYIHFSIWWIINESIIHIVHIATIYKIMSNEWKTRLLFLKIKNIFVNKPKIDYWRYLAIIDFISAKKAKKKFFSNK